MNSNLQIIIWYHRPCMPLNANKLAYTGWCGAPCPRNRCVYKYVIPRPLYVQCNERMTNVSGDNLAPIPHSRYVWIFRLEPYDNSVNCVCAGAIVLLPVAAQLKIQFFVQGVSYFHAQDYFWVSANVLHNM